MALKSIDLVFKKKTETELLNFESQGLGVGNPMVQLYTVSFVHLK
jgi:hypothetical protein